MTGISSVHKRRGTVRDTVSPASTSVSCTSGEIVRVNATELSHTPRTRGAEVVNRLDKIGREQAVAQGNLLGISDAFLGRAGHAGAKGVDSRCKEVSEHIDRPGGSRLAEVIYDEPMESAGKGLSVYRDEQPEDVMRVFSVASAHRILPIIDFVELRNQ